MNKYFLLFLLLFCKFRLDAQCLTSSLVINTGYNPITRTAIPGGVNGATPVPDPYWIVTYESPGIALGLGAGVIEVVPGAAANIITTLGGWISAPPGTPAGWISCMNSNTYTTDGTGPSGTPYNMKLTRPFKNCTSDNYTFDFYIANDNYISAIDVDGILTTFSQPPVADPANFTAFSHYTQTFFLAAGTHNINVIVNNYNELSVLPNPSGMLIYGTVSSTTSLNSLVSESYSTCATYACGYTCNTIALADSLHPCAGDVVTLAATVSGPDSILDYLWSPVVGLSSSTILAPTLTVGASSSYYGITVRSLAPNNLVANGDFSLGNTGFTSSYSYVSGPSSLVPASVYAVVTNPFSVHPGAVSFADHTTGTGNMMAINGASSPISVWCENIPVTPNTDYYFSAWVANWSTADVGPGAPILQFQINGILIGTPDTITAAPGVWTRFFTVWNSGVSTTANICIYDEVTVAGGNDFSLDDITFQPVCTAKDSIFIDVAIPDTTKTSNDTIVCVTASPLTLIAPTGYLSYSWNTGATTNFLSAPASGTYWVYCINRCAVLIDTFHLTYMPLPVVNLGNDTAFCVGNTLTLTSPQPPGFSFLWSTGDTSNTITISTTGTYWLQVTNGYCTVTDTIHVTISPFPIVDLGPDLFNCTGTPFTLGSSITYTAPTYLWSDGTGAPTITASTSGTYWLQVTVGGCPGADTIDVVVIYDTFTLSNVDTAICRGKYVDTRLTAYPTATFQWLPTAGIATPTARVPRIVADTSAMYYVTISLPGCPDLIDSFYIDVQPVPQVSITGTKYVCKFDTIHLHAAVTPPWYNHYTYHWSPPTFLDDTAASVAVFTGGDSTKLVLTVTTPIGCTGIDSALIVVYPRVMAGNDTAINLCPHDSVQLTPTPGLFYTWHPATYLSDSLSASPWVHAVNSIGYTAIAKDSHGCRDTLNASVMIRPAGRIFLGDSVTIYPGEEYHIQPQTNCVSFAWFPHAGLNNASVSDPIAKPELSTKYIVHGWTEYGCEAVDSINIYYDISSLLALPNAFTPGSSINNAFKLLKRGDAELNYFRIYNRWGNLVFETKDINVGWDGNYKGKPQPFGVYVYQIEATTNTGKVFQKSGNVTLVR